MAGPFYVAASGDNTTGTSWATAKTTFAGGVALLGAGEILYVDKTHNENLGASTTFTFPGGGAPCQVVSATNGGTTAAAGAAVNSNGNFYIRIDGMVAMYGMTFVVGTGSTQTTANIGLCHTTSVDAYQQYEKCTFNINSTGTSQYLALGTTASSSTVQGQIVLRNCTATFGATGHCIAPGGSKAEIYNLTLSGTAPTTLFLDVNAAIGPMRMFVSGSDLSSVTNIYGRAGADEHRYYFLNNCKIPTTIVTGAALLLGSQEIEVQGCSNATDASWEYWWYGGEGSVIAVSSVYLTTGGATTTDNAGTSVPYSLMLTPAATAGLVTKASPLYSPWIYTKLTSTGSKTFTVQIAHTETAVLKDSEAWIEVDYMGGAAAANVPQSQLETSAPVTGDASSISRDFNAAGSNLTDVAGGSNTWTGITSEKTHNLAKTVTVDEQGYARVRVGLGLKTTNPVYVDPKIAVT